MPTVKSPSPVSADEPFPELSADMVLGSAGDASESARFQVGGCQEGRGKWAAGGGVAGHVILNSADSDAFESVLFQVGSCSFRQTKGKV